ncbi:MAG: alpha/beta hydrolase [Acidimicrobiia bacterium]
MRAPILDTEMAHDDTGGTGRLLVLVPGAGDIRSEFRFMVGPFAANGYRVVTADLPGHGESPLAAEYTVAGTAAALIGLIEELGSGPVTIVSASFAPAAAVWAATDRPDLIDSLVSISPHFHADPSVGGLLQRWAIKALLRGPWAATLWSRLYAGWYKESPPSDLGDQIASLRTMLREPGRRRAVRETLVAGRDGVADRMAGLRVPTLTVFGELDDHFADPALEARTTAAMLGGAELLVPGAGHYPHVEQPEMVCDAIVDFLADLR